MDPTLAPRPIVQLAICKTTKLKTRIEPYVYRDATSSNPRLSGYEPDYRALSSTGAGARSKSRPSRSSL